MASLNKAKKVGIWAYVLVAAELAVLLRHHWKRLDEREQKRLPELVRKSKGRPSNLTIREKRELRKMVDKIGPRELAVGAADKVSPVGIPNRIKSRLSGIGSE
jgi:hypothetical protein